MDELHLDYESRSDVDLKQRGLDVYSDDPSTEILMCSYAFNDGPIKLWDRYSDGPMPLELRQAIVDKEVRRWAFNMPFELVMSRRVAKLKMPFENTRCTMALAYLQSFTGSLGEVGKQMLLPPELQKDPEGDRLIQVFCKPQKITKANPHLWRGPETDPEEWEKFRNYCITDTESERAMKQRLIKYPIRDEDWALYELDLRINCRGFQVDPNFSKNSVEMSARRKEYLLDRMKEITGLDNPNSQPQLLPWLKAHGYPFNDLQKNTIKKVLFDNAEMAKADVFVQELDADGEVEFADFERTSHGFLKPKAQAALLLRQQASRTSTTKHKTLLKRVGKGDRYRFGFQYAGASGTARWSGRAFQPHNLASTPPELENEEALLAATQAIRENDYDMLELLVSEPMNALAGTVRSTIVAPEGKQLVACDLSSIETCVIGWLAGCERMLDVFRQGRDPYKDFATMLFDKPYEEVTKGERKKSKPAVLGSGFRLGPGEMRLGKKTGLWGYAENMGIILSQEEATEMTRIFRKVAYPEIPYLWYALEEAVERAMRTKKLTTVRLKKSNGEMHIVPIQFEYMKPYLTMILPSGRRIYYYKPAMMTKTMKGKPTEKHPDGEPWTKRGLTYMRKDQVTKKWKRRDSHGGLLTENAVQAIARDILGVGMLRATAYGFSICLHVHDEIVAEVPHGDNRLTKPALIECMSAPISWCQGLPLGAAGWVGSFYKKD